MREIIVPPEAFDDVTGDPVPPGYRLEIVCMYRDGRRIDKTDPEFREKDLNALYRAEIVKAQ
jgi:hypothetical protein